jgi:hypothetical protein
MSATVSVPAQQQEHSGCDGPPKDRRDPFLHHRLGIVSRDLDDRRFVERRVPQQRASSGPPGGRRHRGLGWRLTTTDSNVWGGASGYAYTLTPQPDGTTDVDVVIVREGKNLKGRVLAAVLGTVGKNVLRKAFSHSVKAIEARSVAPTTPS